MDLERSNQSGPAGGQAELELVREHLLAECVRPFNERTREVARNAEGVGDAVCYLQPWRSDGSRRGLASKATGTPAGVGAGFKPPRFLKRDDVVSITIERIGQLTNRVA
jgi:hypothetical protein